MSLHRIVIGTRNRKKGEEMAELLSPPWDSNPRLAGLIVATLADYPDAPEVDEDAATFAANARKKASETACAIGEWVLADDSGLAVDALGGEPGVFSARYAGKHGDDFANNAKLLAELEKIDDDKRTAAFVCSLALADPQGNVRAEARGECRGVIARAPRGQNGFGYDPLFLIPEYHRTFGELSVIVKHMLSHRARAFSSIRPQIERLVARA